MKRYFRVASLLLLGMALLFIDFISKAYVYYLLPIVNYRASYPYGGIGIFKDFFGIDFAISLAVNRGAAWGVFADFQILLVLIRILVIFGMLSYLLLINKQRALDFPLVLIISGAIGNVLDFFLYGYVIDFFHFIFWGYHFPVFNIADTAITLGVFWLLVNACLAKRRQIYHA